MIQKLIPILIANVLSFLTSCFIIESLLALSDNQKPVTMILQVGVLNKKDFPGITHPCNIILCYLQHLFQQEYWYCGIIHSY
jgi:hypothetical protein